MGCYTLSKYLSTEYLLITKGRQVTFQWRSLADIPATSGPGKHHQLWVRRESPASRRDARRTLPHFCDVPAKDTRPLSNDEEPSEKPKLSGLLRNHWSVTFASAKVPPVKASDDLVQSEGVGDETNKGTRAMGQIPLL